MISSFRNLTFNSIKQLLPGGEHYLNEKILTSAQDAHFVTDLVKTVDSHKTYVSNYIAYMYICSIYILVYQRS